MAVRQLAQKTQSNGKEEGHNFAPRTRECLANKNGKLLWAHQLAIVFSFSLFLEGCVGEATGHMPLVREHVWDNWVASACCCIAVAAVASQELIIIQQK